MIQNHGSNLAQPVALTQAQPGDSYHVENVSGPEQQRLRLNELGIVSGADVSILSSPGKGALVIRIGGARVALTREMCEHIWVKRSLIR